MSRRLYLQTQLAAHRVRAAADQHAKSELGVTSAQLGMLFTVGAAPGCTQRDVAQALGLRESAVTPAMGRLVKQGLVCRERADGRSFALSLSPAGRSVTAQARPLVARIEQVLAEGFDEHELDTIARFLRSAQSRFGADP